MGIVLIVALVGALAAFLALAYLVKRKFCQPVISESSLEPIEIRKGEFVTISVGDPHEDVTKLDAENEEDETRNDKINQEILELQRNLTRDNSSNNEAIISKVKELLLSMRDPSLQAEDCRLIIGVDATPATQAGYCVNLKEKRLDYYVIKRNDFPWALHDPDVSSEFEMKNFMFALIIWKNEILKEKRIRIYTDNFAITRKACFDEKKYGDRAYQVLCHYISCEGVKVLNISDMTIDRFKDLKSFVKYIHPADFMSRWQINLAVDFLKELYDIDGKNVFGTHYQDLNWNQNKHSTQRACNKPRYKPSLRYKQVIKKASETINSHNCHTMTCSSSNFLRASLREE